MTLPHLLETADQWFWPYVDRSGGPDACWPWTGPCDERGRPRVKVLGKQRRGHQIAFALANDGVYPVGCGCHRCNFKLCCNAAHIYDGTPLTNAADRRAAGGYPSRPGELNSNAKLTWEIAGVIRASQDRRSVLARRYGVSWNAIDRIKVWPHLERGGRRWPVTCRRTAALTSSARCADWGASLPRSTTSPCTGTRIPGARNGLAAKGARTVSTCAAYATTAVTAGRKPALTARLRQG